MVPMWLWCVVSEDPPALHFLLSTSAAAFALYPHGCVIPGGSGGVASAPQLCLLCLEVSVPQIQQEAPTVLALSPT